ncbi:hypothetical protein C8R45DRAFT_1163286 [Mycena sanguinolenta]|nr:hypothetical protein C8R45DRAFT_1163286 [Mycena sanguinolenta]
MWKLLEDVLRASTYGTDSFSRTNKYKAKTVGSIYAGSQFNDDLARRLGYLSQYGLRRRTRQVVAPEADVTSAAAIAIAIAPIDPTVHRCTAARSAPQLLTHLHLAPMTRSSWCTTLKLRAQALRASASKARYTLAGLGLRGDGVGLPFSHELDRAKRARLGLDFQAGLGMGVASERRRRWKEDDRRVKDGHKFASRRARMGRWGRLGRTPQVASSILEGSGLEMLALGCRGEPPGVEDEEGAHRIQRRKGEEMVRDDDESVSKVLRNTALSLEFRIKMISPAHAATVTVTEGSVALPKPNLVTLVLLLPKLATVTVTNGPIALPKPVWDVTVESSVAYIQSDEKRGEEKENESMRGGEAGQGCGRERERGEAERKIIDKHTHYPLVSRPRPLGCLAVFAIIKVTPHTTPLERIRLASSTWAPGHRFCVADVGEGEQRRIVDVGGQIKTADVARAARLFPVSEIAARNAMETRSRMGRPRWDDHARAADAVSTGHEARDVDADYEKVRAAAGTWCLVKRRDDAEWLGLWMRRGLETREVGRAGVYLTLESKCDTLAEQRGVGSKERTNSIAHNTHPRLRFIESSRAGSRPKRRDWSGLSARGMPLSIQVRDSPKQMASFLVSESKFTRGPDEPSMREGIQDSSSQKFLSTQEPRDLELALQEARKLIRNNASTRFSQHCALELRVASKYSAPSSWARLQGVGDCALETFEPTQLLQAFSVEGPRNDVTIEAVHRSATAIPRFLVSASRVSVGTPSCLLGREMGLAPLRRAKIEPSSLHVNLWGGISLSAPAKLSKALLLPAISALRSYTRLDEWIHEGPMLLEIKEKLHVVEGEKLKDGSTNCSSAGLGQSSGSILEIPQTMRLLRTYFTRRRCQRRQRCPPPSPRPLASTPHPARTRRRSSGTQIPLSLASRTRMRMNVRRDGWTGTGMRCFVSCPPHSCGSRRVGQTTPALGPPRGFGACLPSLTEETEISRSGRRVRIGRESERGKSGWGGEPLLIRGRRRLADGPRSSRYVLLLYLWIPFNQKLLATDSSAAQRARAPCDGPARLHCLSGGTLACALTLRTPVSLRMCTTALYRVHDALCVLPEGWLAGAGGSSDVLARGSGLPPTGCTIDTVAIFPDAEDSPSTRRGSWDRQLRVVRIRRV